MEITAYHGSNSKFDRFIIDPSLSAYRADADLAEGYGIYMTADISLAQGYGDHTYQVVFDSDNVTDFTDKKEIFNLFNQISSIIGIELSNYIDYDDFADGLIYSNLSVRNFCKDITLYLDSDEDFWIKYGHLVNHEDENCLINRIHALYNSIIQPIIYYNDRSFNYPIYLCYRNPEVLSITGIDNF